MQRPILHVHDNCRCDLHMCSRPVEGYEKDSVLFGSRAVFGGLFFTDFLLSLKMYRLRLNFTSAAPWIIYNRVQFVVPS